MTNLPIQCQSMTNPPIQCQSWTNPPIHHQSVNPMKIHDQSANPMSIHDQSANSMSILDQSANPSPIHRSWTKLPIHYQFRATDPLRQSITNPPIYHQSTNPSTIHQSYANISPIIQSRSNLPKQYQFKHPLLTSIGATHQNRIGTGLAPNRHESTQVRSIMRQSEDNPGADKGTSQLYGVRPKCLNGGRSNGQGNRNTKPIGL